MVLAWIKRRKTFKYKIKKRIKEIKGKLERENRGFKKGRRMLGQVLTRRYFEFI
jgi:hypothetical protein